jgi:large subunit ribosomal protein L35Ae
MKATVVQFRRGRRNYTPRHFLIQIDGSDTREKASKFIGKNVIWISSGKEKKELVGLISAAHGNKGLVRAHFEVGLPGQAIGTECEIKDGGKPKGS